MHTKMTVLFLIYFLDGDGMVIDNVGFVGLEDADIENINKQVSNSNKELKKARRFVYQKQWRFAAELTFSLTFTSSVQTMSSFNATESALSGVYNNTGNYTLKGLMRLLCVHHNFNGSAEEAAELITERLESWSADIDSDIERQGFSLRPFGVLRGMQTRAERKKTRSHGLCEHYRSIIISKIDPK